MKQIFINLPVKDLEVSMHFYTEIGFSLYPLFSFDDQKCMAWTDQILVMLQDYEKFRSGNIKSLPDTQQYSIATFTLPVESLDKVNEIVEKGLKAGGKESTPMIDEDFMQVRNVEDPDGHLWGIIYLNMDKFKEVTGK